MTRKENHKHYKTSSQVERILFKEFADQNPFMCENITYSGPEGFDERDVIYTLSGQTKPTLCDMKTRLKMSTYDTYALEEKKRIALTKSATTYNLSYLNVFDDNQILIWNNSPDQKIEFEEKVYQKDNISHLATSKSVSELPASAATRCYTKSKILAAINKAEKIYIQRLNPSHPKKWKLI